MRRVLCEFMAIHTTELDGVWRAHLASDDLRRDGLGAQVDDSAWPEIAVPGHWRNNPHFATTDGPLIYRHRFHLPRPEADQRVFVVVGGVFYQADVWLDGAYLGDPEGYFWPHSLEFTQLARLTDEHVLAVEVACPAQHDPAAKRNLTGVFQPGHGINRDGNPGGIWQPVRIVTSGPVRIDRLRVLCRDIGDDRAHLRLVARLDSDLARRVRVRTYVDGVAVGAQDHSLAHGMNDLDWGVDVGDPTLWWPWGLGDAHLTEVTVEVSVDGAMSSRRTLMTGLREVSMSNWVLSVNGERIHLMGANVGPTRPDIAEATVTQIRHDVDLAREAGLNLLRVRGHVAHPELYRAADRTGMMIWQDMPLHGGYARNVRKQALRQARALVDHLGHHPSIVTWCAHDDPHATDRPPDAPQPSITRTILTGQAPAWGAAALGTWVRRALERADVTRPVSSRSTTVPRAPTFEGGASQLGFGWEYGEVRDLSGFAAAMPRMARFVSGFGAPSLANVDQVPGVVHRADLAPFDEYAPRADTADDAEWVAATQAYQARLLRRQIETLRRLKYRPNGGFTFSSLYDTSAAVSTGVLDVHRSPKAAYHAVTDACAPVIIVADLLPPIVTQGEAYALDVHVVSERRTPLDGAVARATLHWPGGHHEWAWHGDLAADACTRVGTIRFVVPDILGQISIDLSVEHHDTAASNRYVSAVVIAPEVP